MPRQPTLLTPALREWLLRRLSPLWLMLPFWLQWHLLWLINAKFSLGVTGIVFDDQGRVMLLKHTFRHLYPWGLVSGWVKGGEPLHVALEREVAEETDLAVEIGPVFQVRQDRRHLSVEVVFLCRFLAPDPATSSTSPSLVRAASWSRRSSENARGGVFRPNNEVTAICWCHPDELPPGLPPDHYPLIHEAAHLTQTALPTA